MNVRSWYLARDTSLKRLVGFGTVTETSISSPRSRFRSRSRTLSIYLAFYIPVYLSVCLLVSLSACQSFCLPVVFLSACCLSVCLSIFLSVYVLSFPVAYRSRVRLTRQVGYSYAVDLSDPPIRHGSTYIPYESS